MRTEHLLRVGERRLDELLADAVGGAVVFGVQDVFVVAVVDQQVLQDDVRTLGPVSAGALRPRHQHRGHEREQRHSHDVELVRQVHLGEHRNHRQLGLVVDV